MVHLVVERTFDEPLTEDGLERMMSGLAPCLDQYDARWRRSFLSSDRRRMICLYEAADAEAVRVAHRLAGVAFDRVWAAAVLQAEDAESPTVTD